MLNIKNIVPFIMGFLISTASMATDFTVNLRVEYSNLHPVINEVFVRCRVEASRSSGSRLIAKGVVRIPVTDQSLNQDITMHLETERNVDPITARNYTCDAMPCQDYMCNKLDREHHSVQYRASANSVTNTLTGTVNID